MDIANYEVLVGEYTSIVSIVEIILYYYTWAPSEYKSKYNLMDSKWITLKL